MEEKLSLIEKFKDLSDLEFELVFIDSIYKKLKSLDRSNIRSTTLLFMYMSIVESLKKYRSLSIDGNRIIPHEDVIDLLINKGDSFLSSVAKDENKALYVEQSLSTVYDLVKDLWFVLKNELTDSPKYAHLKPNTE
jgi:hypothetical protein